MPLATAPYWTGLQLSTVIFLVSLTVGLLLQPLLIRWLRQRGVVDVPNERSSHITATPRGGGIAVVVALAAGLIVGQQGGPDVAVVLLMSVALGAVGLVDDFRGLSAKLRLVILLGVGATTGWLLSPSISALLAVSVMAVWTAAYVNAFNFMDGINGISGLSGLVAGIAYLFMGYSFGSPSLVAVGAALAGACLSFLPFNMPRARVFLGDVGSYALGFVIAACSWIAWASGVPLLLALAPTSVYLVDTGTTLVRRARQREALMEAHRSHTYQQLVTSGLSHSAVAICVAMVAALVTLTIWLSYDWGQTLMGVLIGSGMLAVYAYLLPRRARVNHAHAR